MRKAWLLLPLALVAVRPAPAGAQNQRVQLSLQLSRDTAPNGARKPQVQVRDLLSDRRWAEALDQSFPIRLNYRLEVWRSREGWIDEFQRSVEWATVIQREALQDQYRVTRLFLSGPEEHRFTTRDELSRWLGAINEVDMLPNGAGSFYYAVSVTISALSDEDMEELERFLAGDSVGSARGDRGSLGKGIRRFLLRVAGLPGEERRAQTPVFRMRR